MNSATLKVHPLGGEFPLVAGIIPMSGTAASTFSLKPQTDENRTGAEKAPGWSGEFATRTEAWVHAFRCRDCPKGYEYSR